MISHRKALITLALCAALSTAHAFANDLRITAITHDGDCTTLTWVSHPGEFYTVSWTDLLLGPNTFWRVAEVNVPSGGTNTTWSDGNCSQMMMAGGGGGAKSAVSDQPALSEEEAAKRIEQAQSQAKAEAESLLKMLEEAQERAAAVKEQSKSGTLSKTTTEGGGAAMSLLSSGSTNGAMRFYRVARTAVTGFVHAWGLASTNLPEGLTNMIAVSAGSRGPTVHSLALRADGTVTAWGNTNYGQCNVPTNLVDVVAVAAGGRHSMALKRDGTVVLWGDNTLGQRTNAPANLTNVAAIAAGLWHSMALRADGTVAAWGDLFIRTNPVPAGLSNVIAIAAGPRVCLALKSDHTVTAWGFDWAFLNNFLPTNVPGTLTNVIAISAGMSHHQALLPDGTVFAWGETNNQGLALPSGLTNVLGMSASWHYGVAVKADGKLVRWGQAQEFGAQGFGAVVAVSAGDLHGLMIRTNNDEPIIREQPPDLAAPVNVSTNLHVGATSALTLSYQWLKNGTNISGATSATLSFPNFQDSDDGLYWVRVSTSAGEVISRVATVQTVHAPVITNQTPELNLRRAQDITVFLSVYSTNKGPSTILPHYRWYKNGTNITGAMEVFGSIQLSFFEKGVEGDYFAVVSNIAGSATSQVWHVTVTLHGEATVWGEEGQGNPPRPNGVRSETNLVAISGGVYHFLGLRENSTVVGWGDNGYGAVTPPSGLTNCVAVSAGIFHSLALKENGTVTGWGSNYNGVLTMPSGLTNVVAIAAGGWNSYYLKRDGTVVGGVNDPAPSGLTNVMAIAAGFTHGMALLSNGTVTVWNATGEDQFPPPAGLTNVVAIAAGAYHCLALKANGTVVGWGDNYYGETNAPSSLTNAMKISAGYFYSMALRNDGTIVMWGVQSTVPAGLGDTYAIAASYYYPGALAYQPILNYPVTVNQDLLLIYNTNSTDSVTVKNYYMAHRPMVAQANVVGVGVTACSPGGCTVCGTNYPFANCAAGECFGSRSDFETQLNTPVQQWLANNPTKRPQYIVLFLDLPSRVAECANPTSVSVSLQQAMAGRKPYITHLNMGGTNACKAYIDKLEVFGTNYSPGRVLISARQGAYGNTNYYFDNLRILPNYAIYGSVVWAATNGVLANGVSSSAITYVDNGQQHIANASNVAGYMSWGANGGMGADYATNGTLSFTGNSGWYVIETVESYNGQRTDPGQGTFMKWFSATAFGGTNYGHTPAAAVTHVHEPHTYGVNDSYSYFGLWSAGKSFAICAWNSLNTPFFQAVGDPLITK
ncbi:MAG TPA: hypothetical protein VGK40_02655 [Verrucomicrobiae bacterium]